MIYEETGEPVECPVCSSQEACSHLLGVVDSSFHSVSSNLGTVYETIYASAGADGIELDPDEALARFEAFLQLDMMLD